MSLLHIERQMSKLLNYLIWASEHEKMKENKQVIHNIAVFPQVFSTLLDSLFLVSLLA